MERILITGANGLIGKQLTGLLLAEGYEVVHLVRRIDPKTTVKQVLWNTETKQLEESVFDGVDHVIHLAGFSISDGRWTERRKKLIRDSRIETAKLLFEKSQGAKLKSFISSSGISYYGTETTETIYQEDDPAKTDFLAQLTVDWEQAADRFASRQIRVVKIRTSVVLSKTGGALAELTKPVKKNLGCVLGNGKQYFPWIHIDDMCAVYLMAVRNQSMQGAYNAVAPEHITNRELTKRIAAMLDKKIWVPPVPGFVLKMLFGEMANIILKGSRISSDKIQKAGFVFKYPDLNGALKDCLTN